jgi:hypothetical protein
MPTNAKSLETLPAALETTLNLYQEVGMDALR